MNETDVLPSSLYALATSFNSVIYSTFASQSNVLSSVGLGQQNFIPIGLHCVDHSKNLQCRFTFLPNSCTKLKCFPELNVCNVCEQAKACIMSSKGWMRRRRWNGCQIRTIASHLVPVQVNLCAVFFRTTLREDMPHWLSLLGQIVQIWTNAVFFYASSQLWRALLVHTRMNM